RPLLLLGKRLLTKVSSEGESVCCPANDVEPATRQKHAGSHLRARFEEVSAMKRPVRLSGKRRTRSNHQERRARRIQIAATHRRSSGNEAPGFCAPPIPHSQLPG